jgi:phage tail sheath gpL-like
MSVAFNLVPSNLRVPFVAVEFDASQSNQGPALLAYSAIIIGQKLTAGSAAADTFVRAPDIGTVIALAGRNSMLHHQAIAWLAVNKSTDLWIGVLGDNGAGVAATGTIVVAGPATASGTITLYLGGVRVTTGVTSGDASTAIATNIAASINATDLPVTASVGSSTVTLTYRHKGLVGNTYDVRANYNPGEVTPAGVGITITALGAVVAGTLNPTLTNLIANMSAQWFEIWTHPYTDATSLSAIEAELLSRSGPIRAIDGLAITSASGTLSTLATLGTGRNSPYSAIVAQAGANPLTAPPQFAAEVAALVALAGAIDPARPFQTLAMANAIAGAPLDTFDPLERNALLFDGIATTKGVTGGTVQLDRMITTYQTNPSGQPDTAYLDATTVLTLLYLRFAFRSFMASKFPRHKLADDGTRFAQGQAVMTPALGRGAALTWFADMEQLGLVQNLPAFKANLVVSRNPTDPNRLDFMLPPNLMNQLIVVGAQVQFRL